MLRAVVDEIFPIEIEDVERGRDILLGFPELSPRDSLHAATMERHGVEEILTFDAGFDRLPGVRRIDR